jgi:hypothetical protein
LPKGGSAVPFIFLTISTTAFAACRVVEWLGSVHDDEACPYDCKEEHEYYFVRVSATNAAIPGDLKRQKRRHRLDLSVDLRLGFRVHTFAQLLEMPEIKLADAWVLLKPNF